MARGLTRFVGRKNSMAALMEAYEKVRNGTGQVVGMVGEAGVGKFDCQCGSQLNIKITNILNEKQQRRIL